MTDTLHVEERLARPASSSRDSISISGLGASNLGRDIIDILVQHTSGPLLFIEAKAGGFATASPFSTAVPPASSLPPSLIRKQQEAVRYAREYRDLHGDPIDDLVSLLGEVVEDDALWQEIVDEPYG